MTSTRAIDPTLLPDGGDVQNIASLVLSVLALLCSICALLEAMRQSRVAASAVTADWTRDLRAWASECIQALCHSEDLLRGRSFSAAPEMRVVSSQLSSLVDQGRMLLPNEREKDVGQDKPAAYRGLRHPALDSLMAAYSIIDGKADLQGIPSPEIAMFEVRREFVSIVQTIIDPRSHNKAIAKLLKLARKEMEQDAALGGLLPNPRAIPQGAEAVLDRIRQRFNGPGRT